MSILKVRLIKALIAGAEKELRDLKKIIVEEAKPLTKEYFDYEIPIAMVEDAGITSIGAVSTGNQLPALQDEYKKYRIMKSYGTNPIALFLIQ